MSDFKKQVLMLLIGAIVGFVPSFIQTQVEIRSQRTQFLLDKRLSALKDLTSALNSNGDLFDLLDRYERELSGALSNPNSDERHREALGLGFDVMTAFQHYTANLRTEITAVNYIFNESIPIPPIFEMRLPTIEDVEGETRKQRRRHVLAAEQEALHAVHELRHEEIESIKSYYKALDQLRSKID